MNLFNYISFSLGLLFVTPSYADNIMIQLPDPVRKGKISVEEAISKRHSVRQYKNKALTLQQVSQLLWAANGITADGVSGASRSFPSAGGLYPLDVYFIAFNIEKLNKGCYRYIPENNALELTFKQDLQQKITAAAYDQGMFRSAAGVIVYSYNFDRMKQAYGDKGVQYYACMDIGHSAENVYLQAEALGIGTVAVGAFDNLALAKLLNIKSNRVIYLLPVGLK